MPQINSFYAVQQTTFMQHDRDRSGTVEPHELHAALTSFGNFVSFLLIFVVVVFVAVVVVFGFFFSISHLELIIRLYQLLETKPLKGKMSNSLTLV